ncbi:MAG: hypothetical protein JNL83_37120 [Myxococcales bacterium]|nr:hypothetical protein [Myxococcales bacterium]
MHLVRSFPVSLGFLTLTVSAASADLKGPAPTIDMTATPKVEITMAPSFTSSVCDKELAGAIGLKNLGATFNSNVVINGAKTEFTLPKDTTKVVSGTGPALDCTKVPAITFKVPSPAGTGPLYQKSFSASALSYATPQVAEAGGTFSLSVTANCGAPMSFKASLSGAPAATKLPVTVSVLGAKLTATVSSGAPATLTTTTSLDCAAAPPKVQYYTTTATWKDVALNAIAFK